MRVFISTTSFGQHDSRPTDMLKERGLAYDMNSTGRKLTEEEILDVLSGTDFDGLIAGTEPLTRRVIEASSGLKVISRVGVGLDNVDQVAAAKKGIRVYNTPGVLTDAVAELTLGLMLDVLRKISFMDRRMRSGTWKKEMGQLLKGKVLGVVGLGHIGTRVAQLGAAFGAKIIYADMCERGFEQGQQVTLGQLLGKADIISFHHASSQPLLDQGAFSLMRDGVILINTSRGNLCEEPLLLEALESGKIGGLGCDVFSQELSLIHI